MLFGGPKGFIGGIPDAVHWGDIGLSGVRGLNERGRRITDRPWITEEKKKKYSCVDDVRWLVGFPCVPCPLTNAGHEWQYETSPRYPPTMLDDRRKALWLMIPEDLDVFRA